MVVGSWLGGGWGRNAEDVVSVMLLMVGVIADAWRARLFFMTTPHV